MKKLFLGIIIGLALGALGMRFTGEHDATDKPAGAAAAAPGAKKENPLQLNPAKRAAAGIVLAKPATVTIAPEVKGFGRILDPTTLVALLAEEETARTAAAASQKELARLKQLHASDANVSAQAVEAAEAAEARDQVAVASAHRRLIAAWGQDITGANAKSVSDALEKGAALARLDLFPGDVPAATAKTAIIALLGTDDAFSAEVLGAAPTVDPQMQGRSFLAMIRERSLPAGATLRTTMAGPGEPAAVLVVPRSAVVYHQGSAWIYVLGEEDIFERKIVSTGRMVPEGVVILTGVDPDEQVVTTGAQQLLSAELQAGMAPED